LLHVLLRADCWLWRYDLQDTLLAEALHTSNFDRQGTAKATLPLIGFRNLECIDTAARRPGKQLKAFLPASWHSGVVELVVIGRA